MNVEYDFLFFFIASNIYNGQTMKEHPDIVVTQCIFNQVLWLMRQAFLLSNSYGYVSTYGRCKQLCNAFWQHSTRRKFSVISATVVSVPDSLMHRNWGVVSFIHWVYYPRGFKVSPNRKHQSSFTLKHTHLQPHMYTYADMRTHTYSLGETHSHTHRQMSRPLAHTPADVLYRIRVWRHSATPTPRINWSRMFFGPAGFPNRSLRQAFVCGVLGCTWKVIFCFIILTVKGPTCFSTW